MTGGVNAFYAELGIVLRAGNREAPTRCFANPEAHQRGDRTPSASVSLLTGAWCCHGCGARGGAYDAARARCFSPRDAMALLTKHGLAVAIPLAAGLPNPGRARRSTSSSSPFIVAEQDVARWAGALQRNDAILTLLEQRRGITVPTLDRFLVGWDGGRLTIPIRDEHGELRGLVRHRPWPGPGAKTLALPGSQRLLFPHPNKIAGSTLILCEGEIDALTAVSVGLPSVAVPGANAWRPEWARWLANRTVIVVPDADAAGRGLAASAAKDLASVGSTAAIVDLDPTRDDGYDLGKFLMSGAELPAPLAAARQRAGA